MSTHLMVGEALVDIVATPDGARPEHPGGSPANVALTLARLGKRPDLLTWLAEDDHGRAVTAHLTSSGVRVLPASYGALRTSTALARIDNHGTATYEFDLDWQLPEMELPGDLALVHTGSIAAVAPTQPEDALRDLLHRASTTATITYDPNLRPSIMGDPHTVRPKVEALVKAADVVKVSDADLAWLHPGQQATAVAHQWVHEYECAMVIVTEGGDGSVAILADGSQVSVPAEKVVVADTVGAGDSFMGALIAALDDQGLLGAANRERLHAISPAQSAAILAYASRIAAITVSREGANPPHLDEI